MTEATTPPAPSPDPKAAAKPETRPTLVGNLKKLAATSFAMPAAIGLLDKYEKDLQLSALLKRIIRNYEAVITALWDWLKSVLPLPPDIDIRFWTFFVLIMMPALVEYLRHRWTGRKISFGRPGFWGVASSIAFIGYCITFSTGGELVAGLIDYTLFMLALIVFAIVTVLVTDPIEKRVKTSDLSEKVRGALFWIGFLAAIALFVLFVRFAADPVAAIAYRYFEVGPQSGLRANAVLASLALAGVFAFGNLRTPAYVFFWFFGIIAIDRGATEYIPSINETLDTILCEDGACE